MNQQILILVLLCLFVACKQKRTNTATTALTAIPKVLSSCKENLPSNNLQRILQWLSVEKDYQHEGIPNLLVDVDFWKGEKQEQLKEINQCSYKLERIYGVAGKVPKYKNHFFITELCFATKSEAQIAKQLLGDMKNKTDAKMKKAYTFIYANKVLLVTINREMAKEVVEFFREEMQGLLKGVE